MPTIIDALVVTLGLDPTAYRKGSNEARADLKRTREDGRGTAKEMEAQGKRAAGYYRGLRNEALQLFAAFTGATGIKDFIGQMVAGNAATGRTAANIGVATQELSAWQGAVKRAGGTAADADTALRLMNSARQSYDLTGTTGADFDFRGLGIGVDNLRSPTETLLKLAEAGERLGRPEFVARLQRIGIPEPTINLLVRGRAAVEALLGEQRKLGAVTDGDAASAIRFQDAMARVETMLTGVVRPAVTRLLDGLTGMSTHSEEVKGVVFGLTAALGALAFAAVLPYLPFVAAAAAIGVAVGGLTTAIDGNARSTRNWLELQHAAAQLLSGDLSGAWATFMQNRRENMTASGGPVHPLIDGMFQSMGGKLGIHRDPATGHLRRGASGGGGISASDLREYFKLTGWSDAAASGIVAGITAEGGSATARNPTSGAYGIGQWLGPRKAAFARMFGHPVERSTLPEQLQFMNWELRHSEASAGRAIAGAADPEAALQAYVTRYMRPGPGTAGDLARGQAALNAARRAQQASAGVGPRTAPAGTSTSSTHIGSLHVHTQANDAHAMARDLPSAMRKRGLAVQAATGLV